MEMGFANKPALDGTTGTASFAGLGDWLGLRARLVAAHATRRVLLEDYAGSNRARGSFAPAAAQVLASNEEDLMCINRTGLADSKRPSGIELDLAEQVEPGERGK